MKRSHLPFERMRQGNSVVLRRTDTQAERLRVANMCSHWGRTRGVWFAWRVEHGKFVITHAGERSQR